MTFLHVCLNVADAEESVAFYEQFGFEESWSFRTMDDETTNRYVADENGFEIQLSDTDDEREFEAGTAWDHLAVKVDDVDEKFASVDHYGVVREPYDNDPADSRIAFVEDPDGHVVELVQPL